MHFVSDIEAEYQAEVKPSQGESPASYAERIGNNYAMSRDIKHKKKGGQFFTPLAVAQFMSNQAREIEKPNIRILDPGCGVGILAASMIESLVVKNLKLKSVTLTCVEVDMGVLPYTRQLLNYIQNWLNDRNIAFTYKLINDDFILRFTPSLHTSDSEEEFDYIISNPPYFKLSKSDPRSVALAGLNFSQPNIYSAFLTVAANLLDKAGQMIFITPRSFTAGLYFTSFRKYFFKNMKLDFVHLFDSRREVFQKENVLQETMIFTASRIENSVHPDPPVIKVSISAGTKDLDASILREYKTNNIIVSADKIIHLPSSDSESDVLSIFQTWHGSLHQYGIEISTGPIVSFRNSNLISESPCIDGCVPMLWLHNIVQMKIQWPVEKPGKGQYIKSSSFDKSLLLPNRNYVILRRFSAKGDSHRLISAPFTEEIISDVLLKSAHLIGVENKLNYIYRPYGTLTNIEAIGLSALLNSRLFNIYFSSFNGNVNVSAYEIRKMPFPPHDQILEIGEKIHSSGDFSPSNCNNIVNSILVETKNIL